MKVTVIGGYGVFGERLCRLLARDGHEVTVAGRDELRAVALAAQIGGKALVIDRAGDLSALVGTEVVVDAAGPFHSYGADPYRLAQWAIAQGTNYLDLADEAGFCLGISQLDAAAAKAGVFALSGVSSVPALSSVVVAHLARGLDRVDVIDTAILPGNRAPRGQSVVDSILFQTGAKLIGWEAGQAAHYTGWSRPHRYNLGSGIVRRGFMIGVPDQQIFPAAFGARTVWFRAGLELRVMNAGLVALSFVRRWTGLMLPAHGRKVLRWLADRLERFGSDMGGMSVAVTGDLDGAIVCRQWRLRAEAGEGPYIPAVAVRTVLRDAGRIQPGARPAVSQFTLPDAVAAMSDLAVSTDQTETQVIPVFATVLGERFAELPLAVRGSHWHGGPVRFTGRGSVERGRTLGARIVGRVFGFPAAGADIPVTVTKTPFPGGEVWLRQFGTRKFRSVLTQGPKGMRERFGALSFDLGLKATPQGLHFPVTGGRVFGIPMPSWALPVSASVEKEKAGRFTFDVRLSLPFGMGLMVHYKGWLEEK